MTCEDYRSALMEAAVGAPMPGALTAHLAGCARCRAALDEERSLLGRIDREVQASLSVAPSAEFLPRVRQRVAEQGKPSQSRLLGWLVPAAVVASLVVAGARLMGRRPVEPPPKQATKEGPPRLPAPGVEPRPASPPAAAPVAVRAAVAPPPRRAEPEVLVPPGQEAILRRFVLGLRSRRVESSSLLAAGIQPREPYDIDVRDIEVKPLVTELETKEQS